MGATATISLVAANTITSFVGQQRAAKGAEAQGNYETASYNQNAALADAQGADAIARGQEAETRERMLVRQTIGAQRAQMAANGIDLGPGSAADVQADTAYVGALDALQIRNNARREAWGFQAEAAIDRQRAVMAKAGGANTAAGIRNQSYGTLLTGALSTYGLARQGGFGAGAGDRFGPRPTSAGGWGGSA